MRNPSKAVADALDQIDADMRGGIRFERVQIDGIPFKKLILSDRDPILYLDTEVPENDNKRDFPGKTELSIFGPYYRSGLVTHTDARAFSLLGMPLKKVEGNPAGIDLSWDDPDCYEVYAVCFDVLMAHGWVNIDPGKSEVSEKVKTCVHREYGESFGDEAKAIFGENWETAYYEAASRHLTEPFSRLWYAANILALVYLHQNDFAAGILWSEYHLRLAHEADAMRGAKIKAAGSEGGRARVRALDTERQSVLSTMALYRSKGHSIANAARLAAEAGVGRSPEANRKLWGRHQRK